MDDTTKHAIKSIFFPAVKDLKSVLIKRGPVEIYDPSSKETKTYELMLFSNGFLFSTQLPKQTPNKVVRGTKLFGRLGSLFDEKNDTEPESSQPVNKSVQGNKKVFGRLGSFFEESKSDPKNENIKSAFLLSDIDRFETLDTWKFRDVKSLNPAWRWPYLLSNPVQCPNGPY